MPKFVTIGYGDEAGYNSTPKPLRDAAHEQDAALKKRGALIGRADAPVTVRNPEGSGVKIEQRAFMKSDLPIAGFAIIEAADMDEAVRLVSTVPCAVCQGVVEIWPLKEPE